MSKIKQGDVIRGYADGYFGRDSYGDKLCIETGHFAGLRYAVFHENSFGGSQFHVMSGMALKDLETVRDNPPYEQ